MNRRNNRRRSLSSSARHRRTMKRQPHPPVMWNIQGMRGKMSSNCLWHACQALFVGILLFFIGGVMSFLGFHADGVFDERGNLTAPERGRMYSYDNRSTNVKFSKLSYAGPIVMGVGGFIIVATCVMTFEARDSAAKVGPAAFVATRSTSESTIFPIPPQNQTRTRSFDVRSVASQTVDSSTSLNTIHLFDRRNIMDTFKKFSKTLRTSSSKEEDEFHKSPSAPNLLQQNEALKSSQPNVSIVPTSIGHRRSSCLPKFRNRVPPTLVRQAMSVECSSSSPFLQSQPMGIFQHHPVASTSSTNTSHQHYTKFRKGFYRTATNTSSVSENYYNFSTCSGENASPHSPSNSKGASSLSVDKSAERSGSSYGSGHSGHTVKNVGASVHFNPGTVDLHLPNGLVTLSVVNNAGAFLGSSSSLRTLSPHPSFQSQISGEEYNSSFDRGSVKSESCTIPKSPMMHNKSMRFRSSESTCRPTLMRQTKVDQSEIIVIPDSDEEPIPEEDSDQEGV